MRKKTVVLVSTMVLGIAAVAAAPAEAIDRAQVQARKEEARAVMAEMQAAAPATKADKAVLVRCDKGESVQAALDKNPGPVTIEIEGICAENVRIELRGDVTLRGKRGDPAKDGLKGVADPTRGSALEIRYAPRVWLEDLSFNGGPASGVMLRYSSATITKCTMNDNAGTGLVPTYQSLVLGDWLESSRNGSYGVFASYGGFFRCRSCDFLDNGQWAARVSDGSLVTLWSTVVEGNNGLSADSDGYVDVDCGPWTPPDHECRLSARRVAMFANWNGSVGYGPGALRGRVDADFGEASLFGAQQEGLPEGVVNLLGGEARLVVHGAVDNQGSYWTSNLAATELRDFTRAMFYEGTEFPSPITCFDAADAVVNGSVNPNGMVINCPHVPEP
jgi:hypothetical protein